MHRLTQPHPAPEFSARAKSKAARTATDREADCPEFYDSPAPASGAIPAARGDAAVSSPAGLGASGHDRKPEGVPAGHHLDDVTLTLVGYARMVLEMDPLEPPMALGVHLNAPRRPSPVVLRCPCRALAPYHRLRIGPPVCCEHWQQLLAHLQGDDPAELLAEQTRCHLKGHDRPAVPR
ncbi:MAG: hypothetical protein Q8R97_01270 [Brevundimonas sp.]|nr:hypothetical protein [Brevundimonas sp.]